jgi:hypothetical protein
VNRAAQARGELAARSTAQTEFGLLAGGDYAHAWDLWSAAAQQAIGRAEFVALNSTCPAGLGMAATVTAALPISDTTVLIQWQRPIPPGADQSGAGQPGAGQPGAGQPGSKTSSIKPTVTQQTGTIRMIYADGAWRFEPADADLRGGLKAQLARRRAAHQCPRLDARKVK